MRDWLDKIFVEEPLKNATQEEKDVLAKLDNESEKLWDEGRKLSKQKDRLRLAMKPTPSQEKERLEKIKFQQLNEILNKIRELKEQRKQINNKFRLDTQFVRKARKEQLLNNKEFQDVKNKYDVFWKQSLDKRNEFHNLYTELEKKYRKDEHSEQVK